MDQSHSVFVNALRIVSVLLIVALCNILFASVVEAQSAEIEFPDGLFSEANVRVPNQETGAATRSRQVQIDVSQLAGNNRSSVADQSIRLNLFEDVTVQTQKSQQYQNESGSMTWIGSVANLPASTVLFVVNGQSVYGTIELPTVGNFSIRPIANGTHIIEQISEGAVLSGEDDGLISDRAIPYIAPSRAVNGADDGSIIDVYVAYDQDASGGAVTPSDAQNYAELFMAYTNLAYENSNINQRVWLVGVEGYDYTDTNTSSQSGDLSAATNGQIAGLHDKRDEYHADLVLFFVPLVGNSCGGVAWLQTQNNNVGWESNGYSAMEACSYGNGVFAHELGHNMGSRHDWYMDNSITPQTYAHGYVDTTNNFRTIMSYSNRCSALGISCPRLAHFSSSTATYNGLATGVAGGTADNCSESVTSPSTECDADNTRNFNEKASTTSQFRASQITWTGAANTNWANAANWEIQEGTPAATTTVNRVPRSFDNILIPSGLGRYPTISSGTAVAREVIIANGATLNMTGGTLTVGWRWADNGGFNATGGTVVFDGQLDQTLTTHTNSNFYNVQFGDGGTQSITLNSDLNINGDVTFAAGATFNAGSNTVYVAGDWTEADATGFKKDSSTVIFDGTNQAVSKTTSGTIYTESFSRADGQSGCSTAWNPSGWSQPSTIMYGCERTVNGNSTSGAIILAGSGWIYPPALTLNAGVDYNVTFDIDLPSSSSLAVYYGTSSGVTSTSNLIGSATTGSTSLDFTVPSDGAYYLRINHTTSGSWTDIDNFAITSEKGIDFYNLEVAAGETNFGGDVAVENNLRTDAGSVADFGTNNLTVERSVTNNGGIKQTKTVANGVTTEFGRIRNAASTSNKYYGVRISPSSGSMGDTTVEIRGAQTCDTATEVANGVERCYVISPAAAQTSTTRFYYRSAEENANTDPDIWLQTGARALLATWTKQTTTNHGGSGASTWAEGSLTSYGTFALAESGIVVPPTATPTNTPTATPTNTPTATPTATPTNTPTATPSPTPGAMHFAGCSSQTGQNATVIVPSDVEIANNQITLAAGDEIGIFGADNLCVGVGIWNGSNLAITAWGDDSQTGAVDGLLSGETMQLRIWDTSAATEFDNINVTYTQGNGLYTVNSIHRIGTLDLNPTVEQTLSLSQGWNIVSAYTHVTPADLETALASIDSDLVLMKNSAGQVYLPGDNINQIGDWNVDEGYQMYLQSATSVTLNGQMVDVSTHSISLSAGWSIIAYHSDTPMAIENALSSLGSALVLAKNSAGQVYLPDDNINQIGNMQPGQGYQIYLNTSAALTYPAVGSASTFAPLRAPMQHFTDCMALTGSNATVVLYSDSGLRANGQSLTAGDEVAVYRPNSDQCVGVAIWTGSHLALTAWGDNTQTAALDGLVAGEELRFRAWLQSSNSEHPLEVDLETNGVYQTDALMLANRVPSAVSFLSNQAGTTVVMNSLLLLMMLLGTTIFVVMKRRRDLLQ